MTDPTPRTNGLLDDMTEAARLMQSGRTGQATALIQKRLGGLPNLLGASASPGGARTGAGRAAGTEPDDHLALRLPEKMRGIVDGIARSVRGGLAPVLKGVLPPQGLDVPAEGRAKGAPAPAGEGRVEDLVYKGPAGERTCKLFVPGRPANPAMLLVMLHGCTQSPDDFAAGTGMNALAEEEGFLVAYPAQTARANQQRCWNWFEPGDQKRGSGEAEIIAGLTRTVMERYPVDRMRVYIAGFSAGGAAAVNVARAYPDLYAAVGIHSGLAAGCARDLPSALSAMRSGAPGLDVGSGFGAATSTTQVPTIVIHGDGDLTVNVRNGRQILAQAGIEGLTAISETVDSARRNGTRTRYADGDGRIVVESLLIDGLGHAWSGGRPDGSYTDASGPDASRAILEFFKRHSLAAGRA